MVRLPPILGFETSRLASMQEPCSRAVCLADEAKRGYVCDMGFGTGAFNGAKRLRPATICPAAALPRSEGTGFCPRRFRRARRKGLVSAAGSRLARTIRCFGITRQAFIARLARATHTKPALTTGRKVLTRKAGAKLNANAVRIAA